MSSTETPKKIEKVLPQYYVCMYTLKEQNFVLSNEW